MSWAWIAALALMLPAAPALAQRDLAIEASNETCGPMNLRVMNESICEPGQAGCSVDLAVQQPRKIALRGGLDLQYMRLGVSGRCRDGAGANPPAQLSGGPPGFAGGAGANPPAQLSGGPPGFAGGAGANPPAQLSGGPPGFAGGAAVVVEGYCELPLQPAWERDHGVDALSYFAPVERGSMAADTLVDFTPARDAPGSLLALGIALGECAERPGVGRVCGTYCRVPEPQ